MTCCSDDERGATSILVLGIAIAAAFLLAILTTVGGSYVAHAELQQAADVAARALETNAGDAPRARARQLAQANGARGIVIDEIDAGARLRVRVTGRTRRLDWLGDGFRISATAYADVPMLVDGDAGPNPAGIYAGPLEAVPGGVQVCPGVARAFRAMHAAATGDGVSLIATSGFRGWAEQAALYAQLGPRLAAPPGASRHHDATELDLAVGPAGSPTHRWLAAHASGFGFLQRYSWEPWHWGFVAGCGK